jgi:hypothetical protein
MKRTCSRSTALLKKMKILYNVLGNDPLDGEDLIARQGL